MNSSSTACELNTVFSSQLYHIQFPPEYKLPFFAWSKTRHQEERRLLGLSSEHQTKTTEVGWAHVPSGRVSPGLGSVVTGSPNHHYLGFLIFTTVALRHEIVEENLLIYLSVSSCYLSFFVDTADT
jgi:hypothetical protein